MSLPAAGARTVRRNQWFSSEARVAPKHSALDIVSVNLEHRPISMPEFLGGGMALATVALIAFGALRFASSHNSPPPPANYAPVSIESPEVSVKSLVEQPKESSDVAATRDVKSRDTPLATGSSTPVLANEAGAPQPPAA